MVLIDSDVFVLDLFYPEDARTGTNKRFLERDIAGRVTTVFNVLEVCGEGCRYACSKHPLLTLT